MPQFRDIFDAAQTPQSAAFALKLGHVYNAFIASLVPNYSVGNVLYADSGTTFARLAPNTTATKMFLRMTGTGTAGTAPVWETIEASDVTDFNEAVDDRVAALIVNGGGITWSYNDAAGTLTGTVTPASIGAAPDNATYLTLTASAGLANERVFTPSTGLSAVDGGAGAALTVSVTLAPFSTSNLAEGANLYFTDERAQDAVGAILTDTATIDFTYNDAGNQISAIVIDDSITDVKLRDSAGLSLIGRGPNTTGNPADIAAASDKQIMRREGTSIAFGSIDLSHANAVGTSRLAFANLTQGSARSVLGVAGNATANFAIIQGTTDQVLRVDTAGTGLGFGTVTTGGIADNAVTNAKLRDSTAVSVIGRSAISNGDPADIQAAADGQVLRRASNAVAFGAVNLASSQAVTGTLPVANGGTGVTEFPAFSAHRNGTNQTAVATATFTKIQFNNVDFNIGSDFDSTTNFRFTPGVAGKYIITLGGVFDGIGDGVNVIISIWKNGARFKDCSVPKSGGAGQAGATVSAVIDFNGSTDFVEGYCYHEHGSNRDLFGSSTLTHFTGARICA